MSEQLTLVTDNRDGMQYEQCKVANIINDLVMDTIANGWIIKL